MLGMGASGFTIKLYSDLTRRNKKLMMSSTTLEKLKVNR